MKYYICAALPYTASKPHIGNIYEAVLTDAHARYLKLLGYDVLYSIGTDEHGLKNQEKAREAGKEPYVYVTEIVDYIKYIYSALNIQYDLFNRTTDSNHQKIVQDIFQKLFDSGDIYLGEYEGHYCKACESYYTKKQLTEDKCPDCSGDVFLAKEEAYFFRLSKYQDFLVAHITDNPSFLQPEPRKNEILRFLEEPLMDLCVSRTSFDWGIRVPFNSKHVVYVWLDALANYITCLGYDANGLHNEMFEKYWPCDAHIIGKDIMRFHAVYWTCILKALDLPLPKMIFGHPWVLASNGKMSKSKNNVVYTDELLEAYGCDVVRYYLLHEMSYINDMIMTPELIIARNNSDLANTLGNLVNRTIAMQRKYFPNGVVNHGVVTDTDRELVDFAYAVSNKLKELMEAFKTSDAFEEIFQLARRANKYIDENEPWKLAKESDKAWVLENVLYHLLEVIRYIAVLLQPFLPETASKIFSLLNTDINSLNSLVNFGRVQRYQVGEPVILFKRLEQSIENN